MTGTATTCQWLNRIWLIATALWLAFISWRTVEGWPSIPLDMGGDDPTTVAAFQAAQLRHVAMAVSLAIAAPAIAGIFFKLLCRGRRR